MRSVSLIAFALTSVVNANEPLKPSPAVADATITAAPEIPIELLRKQNDNRFMGWLSVSSGYSSVQCDLGGSLYQSGNYWRCCATTAASCNIPIGCVSGSLIYTATASTGGVTRGTVACTSVYTGSEASRWTLCNTGFIFENTADSDPETNVFCGASSVNWSYYRVKPGDATTTSSSARSSGPSSASASVTGASSSTGLPVPVPRKKGGSKAWIAGVVIGPLVGLAIIGLLLWFFLVKRKSKDKNAPPAGVAGGHEQKPSAYPPMQQNAGVAPYGVGVSEAKPGHESFAHQPPHAYGSGSPPYGSPPPQMQQWQPMQQPGSPQMMGGGYPHPQGSPPPMNHSPQQGYAQPQEYHGDVKHSYAREGAFSSELEGNQAPPPAAPPASQPAAQSSPHQQRAEVPGN